MMASGHALIGVAIAIKIPNPALALPIIFLSHFALDFIPHWDLWTDVLKNHKSRWEIFLRGLADIALGFLLVFIFFGSSFLANPLYLFTAIILSQALDWLEIPYVVLGWKFPPFSWIYNFQHAINKRLNLPWGLLIQIAVVGIILLALNTLRF